jgi:hypothetical protein
MARVAWEAYVAASANANINIAARKDARVVQTVGDAPASKGFHAADGEVAGEKYSAAVDLSVRNLTRTEIATWLEELCRAGFCGWFRDWPGNRYIHANYAGLPMKPELRAQCRDFFAGRNGLAGHAHEEFWTASPELRRIPRTLFNQANGKVGGTVASPLLEKPETTAKPVTYALYLNEKLLLWMPVQDGVALAPIRAWGTALGFDVNWIPKLRQVQFNGRDVPIPITLIAGVGHAPIRKLAEYSGLRVDVDVKGKCVTVTRTKGGRKPAPQKQK